MSTRRANKSLHRHHATGSIASFSEYREMMIESVSEVVAACPQMRDKLYIAGSMPVILTDEPMAISIDQDWRTKEQFANPGRMVQELKNKLGERLEIFEADEEYGIYRCVLYPAQNGGIPVSLDIFSSFEPAEAKREFLVEGVQAEAFEEYIYNKVQCLRDRREPKDLFHLCALSRNLELSDCVWNTISDFIGADELLEHLLMSQEDAGSIDDLFAPEDANQRIPGFTSPTKQEFLDWIKETVRKVEVGEICQGWNIPE